MSNPDSNSFNQFSRMSAFFLGVAVGSFMAAFIKYRYNTSKWIKIKYLIWIGILALMASIVLGWPDIQGWVQG